MKWRTCSGRTRRSPSWGLPAGRAARVLRANFTWLPSVAPRRRSGAVSRAGESNIAALRRGGNFLQRAAL